MSHRVQDWMSSPVVVVDPDSSVSYALTLMRRRNIHSLIVASGEEDSSYGILTTTDIRDKIIATDRKPAEICVREIMSVQLVYARPDWTLKDCSVAMQRHNIHHMPVMAANGSLVGMISATDLFIAAEEIGWEEEKT
jgi:CBS domain-containing protein